MRYWQMNMLPYLADFNDELLRLYCRRGIACGAIFRSRRDSNGARREQREEETCVPHVNSIAQT